jgi:hypothetical protein
MSVKSKQCKCASCAGAACKCGCRNAKTNGPAKGCNCCGMNVSALPLAAAKSVRCKLSVPRSFALNSNGRRSF